MTDEISLYYHTSFNFKETDGTIHVHDTKGMYSQSVCLTGLAIERPITYNNSLCKVLSVQKNHDCFDQTHFESHCVVCSPSIYGF